MLELLKTEFYKLRKSKAFWICLVLSFAISAAFVFAIKQGLVLAGLPGADKDLKTFLDMAPNLGGAWVIGQNMSQGVVTMIFAAFVSIFVSSEFQYGTMKNTLSRGRGRTQVYLSKLIVGIVAGLAMLGAFVLASGVMGSLFWGWDPNGIVTPGNFAAMLLSEALLMSAFTAVFVLVGMTMRSSGGTIAVNILLVVMFSTILSAIGLLIHNSVNLSSFWLSDLMSAMATLQPAAGAIPKALGMGVIYLVGASVLGLGFFRNTDVK